MVAGTDAGSNFLLGIYDKLTDDEREVLDVPSWEAFEENPGLLISETSHLGPISSISWEPEGVHADDLLEGVARDNMGHPDLSDTADMLKRMRHAHESTRIKRIIAFDGGGDVVAQYGPLPVWGTEVDPLKTDELNFLISPDGTTYTAAEYKHDYIIDMMVRRGEVRTRPDGSLPGWLKISSDSRGRSPMINDLDNSYHKEPTTQRQFDTLFDLARSSSNSIWAEQIMNGLKRLMATENPSEGSREAASYEEAFEIFREGMRVLAEERG